MNNNRSAVGALLVSLGLAAGLAGCNKSAAPAGDSAPASGASAARAQQVVSVFTAQQRDVPVTVEAAGTVVALESVDLRPQISGVIAEVLVREGQFVRRGQTLFKLDDRADRANLERARAQLLRDQASLADLDRQWKRAQDLRAQNFIAQSAADTVLANLEAQRAAVAADAAAVRSAEVALSFTSLQAPLNGRVGTVNVKPGSLVQPTGTMLLNISQIDPIGVQFSVPEAQLAALLRATGDKGDKGGNSAAKPGTDTAASVAISIPSPERGRQAAGDALQGKVVFV
ncbi:MAG TPA: efflux RND transporter periplasmic adaptor subunit, partial [Ramlibacter sp.]|nr:efflux RND transporter periplasmic adaptor subunit [Ramlibacter sp.]